MATKPTYEELEQRIKELESHLEQMEDTLRVSVERNRLATSAAKVGVWDWNIKTGDFYLDPNIKAILGYTDDEIPNDVEIWVKYVHPEDSKAVMESAQACLDGKTAEYIFEHRMLHKDGSIRWILVRGKAIRDESGNAVRLIGTDADITDRKQAEMALIAAKQEIESIVKTVPDIIYRLDPYGRITFVSDSVKRYGYQPEELLGTKVMKIVYAEDRAETIHRIKERRTGERSTKSFETRLITKNQTPVSFDVFTISAEGLYEPGKFGLSTFLGTQGIARDITARKQVEEERDRLISNLQGALNNIKTLKGLLPICANCKKIRDDKGYWNQIETYIRDNSDAKFSHSICPHCAEKLYGHLQ
jgi:PAS domain S-box-containing protein